MSVIVKVKSRTAGGSAGRLTTLLIVALLASCGGELAGPTTTTEATTTTTVPIILTGVVDLAVGDFHGNREDRCWGDGGYDDIRGGANVVARDGDGNTLGVASLSNGEYQLEEEWFDTTCRFTFEIELIREAPFYTVEIAGRSGPTYTHDDVTAQDWHIELALG